MINNQMGCCAAASGDEHAGAKLPLNEDHIQGQPSHVPGSLEQHLIRTNHPKSAQELTVGYLLRLQPYHDAVVTCICMYVGLCCLTCILH